MWTHQVEQEGLIISVNLQCGATLNSEVGEHNSNNYGLLYLYITIVNGAYTPTYNWGGTL